MPKRLLVLHLHRTEALPAEAPADNSILPPHIQSRVVDSQWAFAGADSTPVDTLMRAMRLPVAQARDTPLVGDEWSSTYPISELLDVRLLPTKPASPLPVSVLPYIRFISEDTNVLTAADGGGAYRDVTFDVYTEKPCWGVLNMTTSHDSGILSWSLTPEKHARPEAPRRKVVRWTSQRWRGDKRWRITVRLAAGAGGGGGARLRVGLHVDYLEDTASMKAMLKKVPAWGTMTYQATGFISEWVM